MMTKPSAFYKTILFFSSFFLCKVYAEPYSHTEKGLSFIESMRRDFGYDKKQLLKIFSQVEKNENILEKISRPAEKTTPWHRYKKIFLDKKRIENGLIFLQEHHKVLNEAYEKYGVSPQIITAILGVETRYGKVMGNHQVITALATIGFDYPKREAFFTKELRAFLQMSAEEGFNPLDVYGSYAGAMGMAQFMPSSYLNFAVDYEGDGKRDLWANPNDAIFSIANYLASHGWQRDGEIVHQAILSKHNLSNYSHKPFTTLKQLAEKGILPQHVGAFTDDTQVGYLELEGENQQKLAFITHKNFAVITTYNTSPMYAMAVNDLAQAIASETPYK